MLTLIAIACTSVEVSVPPRPKHTGQQDDSGQQGDSGQDTGTAIEEVPGVGEWTDPDLCHIELTCDQSIPDDPKIPCAMLVSTQDGTVLYDGLAGVELRGRSSVEFPKPQYAVELWSDPDGTERSANFFHMGADSDWVLNGAYVDRALIRNKLCYDTFQAFSDADYGPQTVACELTLDDDWRGIYFLGERVKRNSDRVDIQSSDDGQSFIIKNDDDGRGFMSSTAAYGEWNLVYPRADTASAQAVAQVSADVQAWETALMQAEGPTDALFDLVDLDSAVDWVIIEELSRNNDAYFLSIHLWKDVDGKLHFIPWDMDLTFGYPVGDCGYDTWVGSRLDIVAKMAEVPAFRQRLTERWVELRAGPLADELMLERIDTTEAIMGDQAQANFERWPFDEITFEWGGQDWLCPVADYPTEKARFRAWMLDRMTWMDENIDSY